MIDYLLNCNFRVLFIKKCIWKTQRFLSPVKHYNSGPEILNLREINFSLITCTTRDSNVILTAAPVMYSDFTLHGWGERGERNGCHCNGNPIIAQFKGRSKWVVWYNYLSPLNLRSKGYTAIASNWPRLGVLGQLQCR